MRFVTTAHYPDTTVEDSESHVRVQLRHQRAKASVIRSADRRKQYQNNERHDSCRPILVNIEREEGGQLKGAPVTVPVSMVDFISLEMRTLVLWKAVGVRTSFLVTNVNERVKGKSEYWQRTK